MSTDAQVIAYFGVAILGSWTAAFVLGWLSGEWLAKKRGTRSRPASESGS